MLDINRIRLKKVEQDDAEFILSLRLDNELNRYLSKSGNDIKKQIDWIINYKEREKDKKEFYFIITDSLGKKYGTIRIYNINKLKKTFEWGSWVLSKNRPNNFSYLSIIKSFKYAFEELKMEKAIIEVIRENEKAIYIYKKIGAKLKEEKGEKLYFEYSKEAFKNFEEEYGRVLTMNKDYYLVKFSQMGDERGHLVIAENMKEIPFEIKRIFYMYGTKEGVIRGKHANKKSKFLLINLQGTCKVLADNGTTKEEFILDEPHKGIFLNKMVWKDMYDFSENSILLVLSSELYDGEEYIRDYNDFLKYIK